MGLEKRESVIGEVMKGFLGRTGGRERKLKEKYESIYKYYLSGINKICKVFVTE